MAKTTENGSTEAPIVPIEQCKLLENIRYLLRKLVVSHTNFQVRSSDAPDLAGGVGYGASHHALGQLSHRWD